jgi:hypothetical protein
VSSDESSDEEEQQQQVKQKQRRGYVDDEQRGIVAGGAGKIIRSGDDLVSNVKAGTGAGNRGIQLALKDVKVEKDGGLLIGGRREVGRTEMEGEYTVPQRARRMIENTDTQNFFSRFERGRGGRGGYGRGCQT